ncbi:hypothetical protein TSAR_014991, partial [Trichomalopsis sarcophagae]
MSKKELPSRHAWNARDKGRSGTRFFSSSSSSIYKSAAAGPAAERSPELVDFTYVYCLARLPCSTEWYSAARLNETMFGSTGACAACGQTIAATELVTRAGGNVFHPKCFTCTKCGTQLTQGDSSSSSSDSCSDHSHDPPVTALNCRYYLLSGAAVCETDFNKMMKSSPVA